MSRRLPDWVASATEPGACEASRLLDGDEALSRLGASATEPLADEVASLLRRGMAPAQAPARGLALRRFTPALGLALLASLVALVSGRLEVSIGDSPRSAAQAAYTAQGEGAWTQQVRDRDGVLIEQLEGVIRYQVDPLPAGQRFRVRARSIEVEVVGTIFEVGLEGSAVWVEVLEGRVSVRDGAVQTVLEPGDRWEGQEPLSEATGHRAPPLVALSEASPEGDRPGSALPAGPSERQVAPTEDAALASQAVAPEHGATRPRAPREASQYSDLLGRVELGERSERLVAELEAFAARSEGPLAELALVTAIEVAAEVRSPQVVIETIDWFLSSHPRHASRRLLLELRGDLARDRLQDCGLALPSYRELAGASAGAQQARAEALRGLCAASLGRVDEARAALMASLQLGIEPPLWTEVHAALDALE